MFDLACESFFPAEGGCRPSEPLCKVIFENEQQEPATPNKPPGTGGRRRSLVSSEPQHVTLIVFGIGMVNRTHLEADIGGLTMEAELKKIHGSFTLKEKMKGFYSSFFFNDSFELVESWKEQSDINHASKPFFGRSIKL